MEQTARALTRSMMALKDFRSRAQHPETLPHHLPDLVTQADQAITAILAAEEEIIAALVANRAQRLREEQYKALTPPEKPFTGQI